MLRQEQLHLRCFFIPAGILLTHLFFNRVVSHLHRFLVESMPEIYMGNAIDIDLPFGFYNDNAR